MYILIRHQEGKGESPAFPEYDGSTWEVYRTRGVIFTLVFKTNVFCLTYKVLSFTPEIDASSLVALEFFTLSSHK